LVGGGAGGGAGALVLVLVQGWHPRFWDRKDKGDGH